MTTNTVQTTMQPSSKDFILECLYRGEVGDAEMIGWLFRDMYRYDHSEKAWYFFNGNWWTLDKRQQHIHMIDRVAGTYLKLAADIANDPSASSKDKENAEKLQDRVRDLRWKKRISNVIDLATRQPQLALSGDEWDCNPMLIGCANGVLDLTDGTFRKGNPCDHNRTAAPTDWLGIDCPASRWEQFLSEVFANDEPLIHFVQQLFGYSLSGEATEHRLPVLQGQGRNGKDTMLETIHEVLGQYAGPVSKDVLLESRHTGGAPTPHLMALRSRRLAWASETNEGARLDAGQVKMLTGGGTIVARQLHSAQIEFKPRYLLMLITNFKPHVSADDYAIWKRLLLLPFTQRFIDDPKEPNEHQRDPNLANKLKAEASGILAWMVRGYFDWKQHGLDIAGAVIGATQEYQTAEDTIQAFIDEECLKGSDAQGKQYGAFGKALYLCYSNWAKDNGFDPMTSTAFGLRMKNRYKNNRLTAGVVYYGIGIKSNPHLPPSP